MSDLTQPLAPSLTPAANPLCLGLMQAVLEQVDYGMAVVNADTLQLLFANTLAWAALRPGFNGDAATDCGMWVTDGYLCTHGHGMDKQLLAALEHTKQGQRALINSVAVMPLPSQPAGTTGAANVATPARRSPAYALLAFPKQQACDSTTVTLFAREQGLTGAEGRVLMMMCQGLRAHEIAIHLGVQISTVRSQMRAIRVKTASASVRKLLDRVSVLPSMARHLSEQPQSQQPEFA
jgi:DNA-binding CsgD family transcriptional regulator